MAPNRKASRLLSKKQQEIVENPSKVIRPRKKLNRLTFDNSNVEEWLYCFLENLATIESEKKKSKRIASSFRSQKQRQATHRTFRSPTPYQWDRASEKSPIVTLERCADSDTCSITNNSIPIDDMQINSIKDDDIQSITESSVTDKAEEKRSLLQRINQYIRAGIEEGKQRAKRYIRKAIAFAVEMGYLVPADSEGKLLRMSPTLAKAIKQSKARAMQKKLVKKPTLKKRGKRKVSMSDKTASDAKKRKSVEKTNKSNSSIKKHSSQKLNGIVDKNLSVRLERSIFNTDNQDCFEVKADEVRDVKSVLN